MRRTTEFAVDFYVMTPAEYEFLSLKASLDGYFWALNASGYVEIAFLEIHVPTGQWVFAMRNPNATVATAVGWVSPLTVVS